MPANPDGADSGPVDALILTAADGEDEAVRTISGTEALWRIAKGPFSPPLTVWRADVPVAGGRVLRLGLSKTIQMGADNAATLAGMLGEHLRPKCLAMCGVCAGRPGWTNLGDVIIADRVYRYDVGELVNATPGSTAKFNADIMTFPFRAHWKQAAERLAIPPDAPWLAQRPLPRAQQSEWVLRELHAGRDPSQSAERKQRCPDWTEVVKALKNDGIIKGPALTAAGQEQIETVLFEHADGIPEPPPFQLHVGPLGTGSNLIRDVDIWAKLATDQRLLRGFDMEASVIGLAAFLREIPWIVVKGVMDFAEPGRGQGFRGFAARAAAEVLVAFLRENLDSLGAVAGAPGVAGTSPSDLRRAYLAYVFQTARRLSLEGVDPKAVPRAGQEAELTLDGVYTGLRTRPAAEELAGQAPSDRHRMEASAREETPALAALDSFHRLVLLGDPGSGKSTFVAYVALCLAAEGLDQKEAGLAALTQPLPAEDGDQDKAVPQQWSHGALLPVRVVLRDFAARGLPGAGQPAKAAHLLEFIRAELRACCKDDFAPALERELSETGGLLLLDGLDEVPEAEHRRDQIKDAVADFAAAFPKCRILVTSRTYAYKKQGWRLPGFHERELAPFSRGQIVEFVTRWYRQVAQVRGLLREDAEGRSRLLRDAIAGSARLAELAARPLLLTLMASLHAWRGGTLPERREELYSDAVDLLLERWESNRLRRDKDGHIVNPEPSLTEWLRVDRKAVRELLDELAFDAHARQPDLRGTADVPADALGGGLLRLTKDQDLKPAQVVEYLNARAGILLPRGERVFTFPHRTFQEYLAACHLTRTDYPGKLGDLVRADPERWREVALLAGAKAGRGAPYALWALIDDLLASEGEPGQVHYAALIAGQAVAESVDIDKAAKKNQDKLDRARTCLRQVIEGEVLPAKLRAEAGDALAAIGDPRFRDASEGCLPADDMLGFVEIPAGPFLMGSDKAQDRYAMDRELPPHRVELPAFLMARFPVTVAQFRAFVQATGTKLENDHMLRMPGTRPMSVVSLDEARAYCAWLDRELRSRPGLPAKLRQALERGKVALPSEPEWEKAARGTDGRIYPWGNEWSPSSCNVDETGIGSTSAVGCFRSGKSPYGCEDICGNVLGWTRGRYEPYPYPTRAKDRAKREAPGGEDRRVLRGASFFSLQGFARAAYRGSFLPAVRDDSVGFRVVVSPSVSDP